MPATLGRASKTKTVNGRVVSAKSKTNDVACSQAVSDWKRNGMTPLIAAILGKCRASAHARKKAEMHAAAGNADKAALLRRKAENTAPTNAADRLARAKNLQVMRKAGESRGKGLASKWNAPMSAADSKAYQSGEKRGQRALDAAKQVKKAEIARDPSVIAAKRNARMAVVLEKRGVPFAGGDAKKLIGSGAKVTGQIRDKYAGRLKEVRAKQVAQRAEKMAGKAKPATVAAPARGTAERLAKAKQLKTQRTSDRQALEGYTASDYRTINTVLRGQGKAANSDVVQSKIAAIDRATNKKLNKDTTLYRGIDVSVLKGLDPKKLVGRTVPSQGFTSTSTSQDVAYRPDFNKGVIIKINAPKGTRGATIHGNTGEKEVVLARNTQLKFTHVSKGGVDDTGKRVTILHADVAGSSVHAPGRNTPMRLDRAKELKAQRSAKQAASSAPSIPAPKGPTALQSLIKSKSAAVVRTGAERVQRRQATLKAAAEFRAKNARYKNSEDEAAYRQRSTKILRDRRLQNMGEPKGISRETVASYKELPTPELKSTLATMQNTEKFGGTRAMKRKFVDMARGILSEREAATQARIAAARAIPRGTPERKLVASDARTVKSQGYSTKEALVTARSANAVRTKTNTMAELDKYIKHHSKVADRRYEQPRKADYYLGEKLKADHERVTSAARRKAEMGRLAKVLSKQKISKTAQR